MKKAVPICRASSASTTGPSSRICSPSGLGGRRGSSVGSNGRRGERPVTPAEGYRWTGTPRLNHDIVVEARSQSCPTVRSRLEAGVKRILAVIGELDDRELLEPGRSAWAGKWPIARWVSINTVRQYTTAKSFVRKAIRDRAARSKSQK